MFWFVCVTANIQSVLLWLECRHGDVCVNAIVNNALFHSNSHVNQMLPQIIPILRFCLVDSLPPEDTNNHVYKLTKDNLQLVLINVLIRSICIF